MAASATFALKAGVWFRRARRCMVSPDSQAIACPLSGRNSTYRPVQISEAGSENAWLELASIAKLYLWGELLKQETVPPNERFKRLRQLAKALGRAYDLAYQALQ